MKIERLINRILVLLLLLAVGTQSNNIAELQKRMDYLLDELYTTTGVMYSIETDLDYHIEKCGAEQ